MKFTISGVRKAAKGILKTYRPNLERRKRTISFLIFFLRSKRLKKKNYITNTEKKFFSFFFSIFFSEAVST